MAYVNPTYYFLHAAADAGYAALDPSPAEDSDYKAYNLIDGQESSLFKHSNSSTSGDVIVDRGAIDLEHIDHLIVPAGHNLATATEIDVRAGTDGASFGTILYSNLDQSAADDPDGMISLTLDNQVYDGERYLRFIVQVPATGTTWEYTQLYFSHARTTTVGIDPGWTAQPVSSTVSVPLPNRTVSVSLAPNRTQWNLQYNALSGTDLAVLDELFEAVADHVPFYFQPPDDGLLPVLVKIVTGSFRRVQDHPIPGGAGGATFRINLSLLEQIG